MIHYLDLHYARKLAQCWDDDMSRRYPAAAAQNQSASGGGVQMYQGVKVLPSNMCYFYNMSECWKHAKGTCPALHACGCCGAKGHAGWACTEGPKRKGGYGNYNNRCGHGNNNNNGNYNNNGGGYGHGGGNYNNNFNNGGGNYNNNNYNNGGYGGYYQNPYPPPPPPQQQEYSQSGKWESAI